MKTTLLITLAFFAAGIAQGNDILQNCYATNTTEFFVNKLEDIATDKETAVLLLNDKKEIVGVMSVSPERAEKYPHQASSVTVNSITLCSTLAVDDFYYADDGLLDWATKESVSISQDEGLLMLTAVVVEKGRYATLYKASFNAYDVFSEDDEVTVGEGQPNFIDDWGLPKGQGNFYFYLPANWSK